MPVAGIITSAIAERWIDTIVKYAALTRMGSIRIAGLPVFNISGESSFGQTN
jgi:hypothetical protein